MREYLGFETIAVLGSSYGGFIAQEYAIRYPDRVSHAIFMDTAPAFDYAEEVKFHAIRKGATPEMLEVLDSLEPETDEDFAKMMDLIGPLYYFNFDPDLAARAMGNTVYSASAARRGMKLLEGWDTRPRLHQVRAPTLVVVGRDDYITPPNKSEDIQRHIASAKLAIFEQSGHMPHLEEPEAFFTTIRDFVRQSNNNQQPKLEEVKLEGTI